MSSNYALHGSGTLTVNEENESLIFRVIGEVTLNGYIIISNKARYHLPSGNPYKKVLFDYSQARFIGIVHPLAWSVEWKAMFYNVDTVEYKVPLKSKAAELDDSDAKIADIIERSLKHSLACVGKQDVVPVML